MPQVSAALRGHPSNSRACVYAFDWREEPPVLPAAIADPPDDAGTEYAKSCKEDVNVIAFSGNIWPNY